MFVATGAETGPGRDSIPREPGGAAERRGLELNVPGRRAILGDMRDTRRTIVRLRLAAVLTVALLPAACAAPPGPPTTVVMIRHAETTEAFGEPQLTLEGQARAEALVDAVGDYGVDAIYASQFLRTQQTVQPLANRLNLPVRQITLSPNTRADAEALAAEILRTHRGQTVLVAGHSNTVPALVEALGVDPAGPIAHDEFDSMFIVRVDGAGEPVVARVRYGPDPAAAAAE